MSRQTQIKNKDLANLEVVDASKVWQKNKKGDYVLSKEYNYYGKVEKGTSAFVSMTNKNGKSTRFVEDSCKLTKKTKNEILTHLNKNNRTKVAWIVQKKGK